MNFMCELTYCTFAIIGALVIGGAIGWGFGFLLGIFWRVK